MSYFNIVCDSCGRGVQGITWVNGMKFCAKCYQETFGASKDWILLDKDKTIAEQQKRIAELEEQLVNSIKPKFKPHNDLFVIVWKSSGEYEIEQYYIDEIVIRGNGNYIEYRDINQKTIIGENNKLFTTKEEAEAKLKELEGVKE